MLLYYWYVIFSHNAELAAKPRTFFRVVCFILFYIVGEPNRAHFYYRYMYAVREKSLEQFV